MAGTILGTKTGRVPGAVEGNFPVFDANGNLVDSGKSSKDVGYKLFGARWNKTLSPTALTRLHDSAGFTFTPSVGSTPGASDFDTQPVYRDIRLCNVADGQVTYYDDEPGFSRTPVAGDVMVEIPRYYYKIEDTPTYRDYLISDKPLDGFLVSPRHAPHDGFPEGHDKIYVSAYTLNSAYRSVSGNQSLANITRAAARAGCSARGADYWQYDFATYWTINLLYLVEVADWDSQAAVGRGVADWDSQTTVGQGAIDTGGADNIPWHSGIPDGTDGKTAVKYRHMENLWGNINSWCDGINFNDATSYICLDPINYADDTDVNYTQLSYAKPVANGVIKKLGIDPTLPFAQICTDATGAYGTFVPDYYNRGSGWRVLVISAGHNSGNGAGLFYTNTSVASIYTNYTLAARLILLP